MMKMKNLIFKLLPFIVGIVFAFLLMNPPEWIGSLGIASYLVMAVVVLGLLLAFVVWQVVTNLPDDLQLDTYTEPLAGEMEQIIERLRGLGFESVGAPWLARLKPPAVVVGLVHPREPIIAAVFRTGTVPPVTAFDLISVLDDGRGGLTTGSDKRGGSLPAGSRSFRQLLHGGGPDALMENHRRALAWLQNRGLGFRRVAGSEYPEMMRRGMAVQRREFLKAPVRHALVAIWRSATGRYPDTVPVEAQRGVEARVERMLRGG
jgi:hypothetical protein